MAPLTPTPTDPGGALTGLLLGAALGQHPLAEPELALIQPHIAGTGFDPAGLERAGGRLSGLVWQGRVLRGRDLLPPAEVHYLRHVVRGAEWPAGTALGDYLASVRDVILDPATGIFTSVFAGAPQVGLIRRAGPLRGPQGHPWVLVELRILRGYWTTAHQPADALGAIFRPGREDVRWWRPPT